LSVIEDAVPVLVDASMDDVLRLLGWWRLGEHHRPQAKPCETLDESQHRACFGFTGE
jgi:hypothetical protein